jgi:hypothetical protein
MSGRGVDFVQNWIADNLAGFHQVLPDDGLVRRLAARCAAEAASFGIAIAQIEGELGSLETVIRDALENDPDNEIEPLTKHGIH